MPVTVAPAGTCCLVLWAAWPRFHCDWAGAEPAKDGETPPAPMAVTAAIAKSFFI